jgi:DNA polymerase sigma
VRWCQFVLLLMPNSVPGWLLNMQTMVWVRRAELRRFARVPIINLVHKNGVECDVSLDMSAEATSVVVAHMKERCGPALFTLSAFLKVYLGQLGLDAPFTGGLGSYKLYVLLAKHLLQQSAETGNESAGTAQLGPLLLSFLKH